MRAWISILKKPFSRASSLGPSPADGMNLPSAYRTGGTASTPVRAPSPPTTAVAFASPTGPEPIAIVSR